MRVGVVLTDLDGTLLEPDGSLLPEAREAVAGLVGRGVPICPITSKTVTELDPILRDLGLHCLAGFENGAGIRHTNGSIELSDAAVPMAELRWVLDGLRRATGHPVRSLEELSDAELAQITELSGQALVRVRQRQATLPLVVDAGLDAMLRSALPTAPQVRLVRGNRFLHLQGRHDKADVVSRVLSLLEVRGTTVACGDAPNDIDLLSMASVRVIVPSIGGPHPTLVQRFPDAVVAPFPHGRGWAAAVTALLEEESSERSVRHEQARRSQLAVTNLKRYGSSNDG